ncbi:MAG: hypothetical protein ABJG78_01465 [Cyclobacteriaceae bacterium]
MDNKDLQIRENELKKTFRKALRLSKTPIIISLFVTLIRFLLELAGLPENAIFIIGLLWLSLAFAVYWGMKLYNEKSPYLLLLTSLIIFSSVSRLTVVVAWWIDTRWEIGTHYSLHFDSLTQAVFQQVIYGSLIQIIPSFLLGSLTIAIVQYRKPAAR